MSTTTDTFASVRSLPLEPGSSVEVFLASGDVRVRGTDEGRLVIRTRDGRSLDDVVTIEAAPGRVRIRDVAGEFRLGPIRLPSRRSGDLDLEVPRGTIMAMRTLSGDLDATGVRGASRWTTASGDLRLVVETGPVAIETMSGDVVLTGEGSLAVTARTVSGDLRLTAPLLDGLDLASTSGDVHVEGELRPGARHVIASVSGDVQLATGSPVRIETRTIAGDVRVTGPHRTEGGRGRRTVVVGSGLTPVEIRTTSGDISVQAMPGGALPLPAPAAPAVELAESVESAPAVELAEPVESAPAVELAEPVEAAPTPAPVSPAQVHAPATSGPEVGAESAVDRREAARLEILRALERGEVDVETASRAMEVLEDAGPRSIGGWS
jgi:DUF4097 and DUF4098 domain-containing protein YvlB